jgi:hypothetical protein
VRNSGVTTCFFQTYTAGTCARPIAITNKLAGKINGRAFIPTERPERPTSFITGRKCLRQPPFVAVEINLVVEIEA